MAVRWQGLPEHSSMQESWASQGLWNKGHLPTPHSININISSLCSLLTEIRHSYSDMTSCELKPESVSHTENSGSTKRPIATHCWAAIFQNIGTHTHVHPSTWMQAQFLTHPVACCIFKSLCTHARTRVNMYLPCIIRACGCGDTWGDEVVRSTHLVGPWAPLGWLLLVNMLISPARSSCAVITLS